MEILVVPTTKWLESSKNSNFNFSKFVEKNFLFIERPLAETNEDYLQLIPYIVVRNSTHIFTYQRLKGGNEARLHAKYSIGIGGHIDRVKELEHLSDLGNLLISNAAYTELYEELTIEANNKFLSLTPLNQYIYDPSNAVGRVHLGVLLECQVEDRKIDVNEKDKIAGEMVSIESLRAMYKENPDKFEGWTQIALKLINIV